MHGQCRPHVAVSERTASREAEESRAKGESLIETRLREWISQVSSDERLGGARSTRLWRQRHSSRNVYQHRYELCLGQLDLGDRSADQPLECPHGRVARSGGRA
jgi:hypothetical protein